MPTYAAFLRSINVADRRVKMTALTEAFTGADFADVVTFQATGNVLFTAPRAPRVDLERRLETALGDALGFEVPTYVRSAAELRAVAACEPFPAGRDAGDGRLQVFFLRAPLTASQGQQVLAHASDADRLALVGRELYWLPRGDLSASRLRIAALARITGPKTLRTKRAVDRFAAETPAAAGPSPRSPHLTSRPESGACSGFCARDGLDAPREKVFRSMLRLLRAGRPRRAAGTGFPEHAPVFEAGRVRRRSARVRRSRRGRAPRWRRREG